MAPPLPAITVRKILGVAPMDRLELLRRGEARGEPADERRGFLDDAVGFAGDGILADHSARRIGRILGDVRQFERAAVCDAQMPGRVHDPDGMRRRCSVEIRPRGMPLLRHERVVVAATHDPLRRRGLLRSGPQRRHDFFDAPPRADRRAVQIDVEKRDAPGRGEVIVGGVKARQQGLAAQINNLG